VFSASLLKTKTDKIKFWIFSILCPIVPDFDILAFKFGIPYAHFFGHRGFSHSLLFGLLFAIIIVFLFYRNAKITSLAKYGLIVYFFILTASHGLLDALTSGGLGVALLAPFDNTRYFFSFTPIRVSPFGIEAFLSERGLAVLKSEIIWIWLPLITLFIFIKVLRKFFYKIKTITLISKT
jgi:inner membrane protein